MKQDIVMKWFIQSSRREKLFDRKTFIKLFSTVDLTKYSPYKVEGIIDNGNPIRGKTYPVNSDKYKIKANLELVRGDELDVNKNFVMVSDGKNNYAISGSSDSLVLIYLCPHKTTPFRTFDPLILYKGDIENLVEDKIVTTYGRFVYNYLIYTSIFNDLFPYANEKVDIEAVENKLISPAAIANKITAEQCGMYIDHVYYPSGLCDIISPTLSRKAITENKEIPKVRKAELKVLREQGLDKDTQSLVKLENKLIKMDKDNLKDDSSMMFLSDAGKKFNTARKRLYSTVGVLETFEKSKGKYDFIPDSLAEGWNIASFVEICNEIRKGSYERGISTAQGGVITKQFIRALQNESITGEDCHTKRTLDVILTENNVKEYYHSNMVINGQYVELNENNAKQYIGKLVHLRSMMFCEQEDGFCFVCAGREFKNMDFTNIGTQPTQMSGAIMMIPMKAMHGIKITTYELNDIDQFVL